MSQRDDFWDAGWQWIVMSRSLGVEPRVWDHERFSDPDGMPSFTIVFLSSLLAGLLGVVLLVVFLLLGLPVWIPIVGTLVGALGRFFLVMSNLETIWAGLFRVLDPMAYRSDWVDRHAEDIFLLTPGVGPPALAITTCLALLQVVPSF